MLAVRTKSSNHSPILLTVAYSHIRSSLGRWREVSKIVVVRNGRFKLFVSVDLWMPSRINLQSPIIEPSIKSKSIPVRIAEILEALDHEHHRESEPNLSTR